MMEPPDDPENGHWKIGKLPVAVVCLVALQVGALIWQLAGIRVELADHDRRLTSVESAVVQLQAGLNQIAISVSQVGGKVDGVGRQLDLIQDHLVPRK